MQAALKGLCIRRRKTGQTLQRDAGTRWQFADAHLGLFSEMGAASASGECLVPADGAGQGRGTGCLRRGGTVQSSVPEEATGRLRGKAEVSAPRENRLKHSDPTGRV